MWLAAAVSPALVHADVVDYASGALLESEGVGEGDLSRQLRSG